MKVWGDESELSVSEINGRAHSFPQWDDVVIPWEGCYSLQGLSHKGLHTLDALAKVKRGRNFAHTHHHKLPSLCKRRWSNPVLRTGLTPACLWIKEKNSKCGAISLICFFFFFSFILGKWTSGLWWSSPGTWGFLTAVHYQVFINFVLKENRKD